MEQLCSICGKRKKTNLVILGKMICSDCEWKIVCARVHDKGYGDYIKAVNRLKISDSAK